MAKRKHVKKEMLVSTTKNETKAAIETVLNPTKELKKTVTLVDNKKLSLLDKLRVNQGKIVVFAILVTVGITLSFYMKWYHEAQEKLVLMEDTLTRAAQLNARQDRLIKRLSTIDALTVDSLETLNAALSDALKASNEMNKDLNAELNVIVEELNK